MGTGKIGVAIVAAGRGERAGHENGPKQYRKIGNDAVIQHTLRCFADHPAIDHIVVAIHRDDEQLFADAVPGRCDKITWVTGGASRQASTRLALLALKDRNLDAVLIHDGVRPFVDAELIENVAREALDGHGAVPALAVSDTLKKADKAGFISNTVSRDGIYAAQTPQGFPFEEILQAHEAAFQQGRDDFTDDAAIAEWWGMAVRIVEGAPDNVKLTWPKDIAMADARIRQQETSFPDVRTGNGYDVHAFGEGDHVMLCGVAIDHHQALFGHSDADVGLHALTDALLATCSAGDIGTHFPPSDPQWKGAASRLFIEEAVKIVRARGGRIANVDVTLICEAPRVGPHREAMVAAMADMLAVSPERISVKATTNERLGFLGREEGIAAIATVSVIYPGQVPQ